MKHSKSSTISKVLALRAKNPGRFPKFVVVDVTLFEEILYDSPVFRNVSFSRPHVYCVEAQVNSAQMLISLCCASTDPDLSCLVVAALLSSSKTQVPCEPSHSTDLSHLYTLVAEQVQCRFTDGGILGAVERAGTGRP